MEIRVQNRNTPLRENRQPLSTWFKSHCLALSSCEIVQAMELRACRVVCTMVDLEHSRELEEEGLSRIHFGHVHQSNLSVRNKRYNKSSIVTGMQMCHLSVPGAALFLFSLSALSNLLPSWSLALELAPEIALAPVSKRTWCRYSCAYMACLSETAVSTL